MTEHRLEEADETEDPSRRARLAALGRHFTLTLRGDRLFPIMLTVAIVMRALVTVAFRPGRELFGDSPACWFSCRGGRAPSCAQLPA